MKIFTLILFVFAVPVVMRAQTNPFELGAELVAHNNYLKAIDTIYKMKSAQSKKDGSGRKKPTVYDQALSFFSSAIGEDYPLNWASRKKQDSVVSPVTFLPAYKYLSKAADNHQVIMINEDHNTPKNRIFTANVLDDLYKKGFRYLCLEGLDEDSLVNQRGYADYETGFYFSEPNMANLLRKAKSIGFKLISYEYEDDREYTNENYGQNVREFNQAKKISEILSSDPKAKILVHTGPGHIWEQGGNVIFMAEYFRMITGIDPFTINQEVNSVGEFTAQMSGLNKGMPYVVVDAKGKPINSAYDHKGDYDLLVCWSPSEVNFGRLNAILHKKGTTLYNFSLLPLYQGKLLQILGPSSWGPVPVDQFRIHSGVTQWQTALEKGNYSMRIINENAKIVWTQTITVK
ncbi:hypothetical protein [Pedobacter jeongneungensis]|uniref:hypothetical protein n=1 Tax=Pedobacter jeongneungensis TaxID=947309 RepID=UPI000468550B|nr:hypothetical protein [Pedobacter jeongneungensis]